MTDETLAVRVEQVADAILKQGRALAYVVNALSLQSEQLGRIEKALNDLAHPTRR
jgi:hypothetical protein